MKLHRLLIYIFLFVSMFASCQYENVEDLYYSGQNGNSLDTAGTDSTKKLLLHLPFNGDTHDESENDHVVIPHGSPGFTYDRFDKPGKALFLNGDNQYIELDLGEEDSIAVSFWFNCASGQSNFSSLFDYGANALKTNVDGFSGPTSFYVTTFYNNLDELNADYYFQYNTWYHIYVSTCSCPEIYVNSQKAGEIRRRIILNLSSTSLIIGKSVMDNTGDEVFFHGTIDDIKIFNYGLTEQEINELYSNTP